MMAYLTKSLLALVFVGSLVACGEAEPAEDEPVTMSTEEDGMQATAVDIGGGEEEDGVGCSGNGNNWCLVKCSKTGNTLHVVGSWNQLGGVCAAPGETFCHSHGLGYRTHACWGHINNN